MRSRIGSLRWIGRHSIDIPQVFCGGVRVQSSAWKSTRWEMPMLRDVGPEVWIALAVLVAGAAVVAALAVGVVWLLSYSD